MIALAEYREAVHAELLARYGVPAPDGLNRHIDNAAALGVSALACVIAIGDLYRLEPLPPRCGK